MTLPRRNFLLLAGAGLLAGESGGGLRLDGAGQDRPKLDMVVRAARPEDLEMPLSGFSDYITPIEHFFVRTHVYEPQVSLASWRLKVDGAVSTPLTLTMDDLRKLPTVELVSVVECAGNGRRFYEPPVPGLQWGHGAVGNGRWKGVRLVDVLKRAGIKESSREILFDVTHCRRSGALAATCGLRRRCARGRRRSMRGRRRSVRASTLGHVVHDEHAVNFHDLPLRADGLDDAALFR